VCFDAVVNNPIQRFGGCMSVKRSIDIVVNRISTILASNNPTILLYGSAVLDDFRLGWSDIDILCLTEKPIDEAQASKLVSLRQILMDEYQGNPYFRLFEGSFVSEKAFFNKENDIAVYWGTSGQKIIEQYRIDPFSAIEIVEHGIALYGKDLRSKIPYPTEKEIYDAVETHYNTIRKYAQTTNKL
jgi:predicted nucleotidyltransferase